MTLSHRWWRFVLLTCAALLIAAGLAACSPEPSRPQAPPDYAPTGELRSFYFEAHIQADLPPGVSEVPDIVRGWYEAPDSRGWEFAFSEAGDERLAALLVSDGETVSLYDGDSNTYYAQGIDEFYLSLPTDFGYGLPAS